MALILVDETGIRANGWDISHRAYDQLISLSIIYYITLDEDTLTVIPFQAEIHYCCDSL
jgi:hypothetical protein